jgi:hypothetical protein
MKTLFYDTLTTVKSLMFVYSLKASEEFIDCADKQLTAQFIKETGVKPGKNACMSISNHYIGAPIYLEYIIPGDKYVRRKLMIKLFINNNWIPIVIFWRSRNGEKDYKLHDTDIDCDDIKFWFENLDIVLIRQLMFPNVKLPFKLKDLSYELVVTRINMDCTLILQLKTESISDAENIIDQIDQFIAAFNQKSEKKDRIHGVIHNWKPRIEGDKLIYDIDLGSTGPYFFKKLLPHLSQLNYFMRVELE